MEALWVGSRAEPGTWDQGTGWGGGPWKRLSMGNRLCGEEGSRSRGTGALWGATSVSSLFPEKLRVLFLFWTCCKGCI